MAFKSYKRQTDIARVQQVSLWIYDRSYF